MLTVTHERLSVLRRFRSGIEFIQHSDSDYAAVIELWRMLMLGTADNGHHADGQHFKLTSRGWAAVNKADAQAARQLLMLIQFYTNRNELTPAAKLGHITSLLAASQDVIG